MEQAFAALLLKSSCFSSYASWAATASSSSSPNESWERVRDDGPLLVQEHFLVPEQVDWVAFRCPERFSRYVSFQEIDQGSRPIRIVVDC